MYVRHALILYNAGWKVDLIARPFLTSLIVISSNQRKFILNLKPVKKVSETIPWWPITSLKQHFISDCLFKLRDF